MPWLDPPFAVLAAAGPGPATGLVVANDADARRCNLLTHQTKRMCSPNVLVTNHEAQAFPLLRNLLPESKEAEKHFLFDRILCDVPCSGGCCVVCVRVLGRITTGNGGPDVHRALHLRTLLCSQLACIWRLPCWGMVARAAQAPCIHWPVTIEIHA